MITFAIMLVVYIIAIKLAETIKPIYFSSFFFVYIFATLILRLNYIHYLELDDMPYYTILFCMLLTFIYSLVDILRNKELNLENYCQYSIVLAVCLEGNWFPALLSILLIYLSRRNEIKIYNNKSFIYTILVMIMASTKYTEEILIRSGTVFTSFLIILFILSVRRLNQLFIFLLSFISMSYSLGILPREFFYLFPIIILLSSLSISREILELALERIPFLSKIVFIIQKYSTEEIVEYRREISNIQKKSFELNIYSSYKPGFENKYMYISGILFLFISYLIVWGYGL